MKKAIAFLLILGFTASCVACISAPVGGNCLYTTQPLTSQKSTTAKNSEPLLSDAYGIEDDSFKIEMIEMHHMSLSVTIDALKDEALSNVARNYDSSFTDHERIIVTSQSVSPGATIEEDKPIKQKFKLYLDLKSEYNFIFDKYDVEVYLDSTEVGIISNGDNFTKLMEVLPGTHQLHVYKSGDHSVVTTRTLTITEDTTFSATISHGTEITFMNSMIVEGTEGASIELIDVTNMALSDAFNALKTLGFINIREEPYGEIWIKENWIVVSQSIEPGQIADKNDQIQLSCIPMDTFFKENYPGKTLAEVQTLAFELGFQLKYQSSENSSDLNEKISTLSEDNKQYWVIDKAEQWTGKTALVYLTYLGTPEERAEAEARAAEEATRAAEEKAAAEAQAALQSELQNHLPKEDATKAIIIAFTNNIASDVFTDDGNHYDPTKFHGYEYNGQYKQSVSKDGTWTALDDKTWHVETIYLYLRAYDLSTKLSCDVTFDGTNYILSNVNYMTASPKYIDTDDKAKTSGWEHIEPDDFNSFLIVPQGFVNGDGGQNQDNEPAPPSIVPSSEYSSWVGAQFSIWDGSHKELTKLIKKALNDEKSYEHIETKYYEMTNETRLGLFNKMLEDSGYSERLELNDLLITTEFSAKNGYNATVKATAIGISRYKNNHVILVGIE